MSLRINVSGFSLKSMLDIFGCDRKEVGIELTDHYNEFWDTADDEDEDDRAHNKRSIKFLRAAVHGKVNTRKLETEDEDIVRAIVAMAYFKQEHTVTDSCEWNYTTCESYYDNLASTTPPNISEEEWDTVCDELLFLTGRPMFGLEFDTDWNYYGYLKKREVKHLLACFDRAPVLEQDEWGFGKELRSWLTEISSKEQDLFLDAG